MRISLVVQFFCSFWASAQQIYGGADGTLLQEGLCHMLECPRSAAARAPALQPSTADPCLRSRPLLTCASAGDTQTLKRGSGSVYVEPLGPGVHKVLFVPSEHLW